MAEDVEKIFGKRPWASRSEEILEEESKDDNAPVVENKDKVEP
jgi:cell division protease FtsH